MYIPICVCVKARNVVALTVCKTGSCQCKEFVEWAAMPLLQVMTGASGQVTERNPTVQ